MAKEKNFENRVKRYLESVGVYALGTPKQKMTVKPKGYYEKRWGSAMTTAGLPDLHIVVKGKSIEIELKAPKGKPSILQKRMIDQIVASGSIGAILYEFKKDIPKDNDFKAYIDFELFKVLIDASIT